MPKKRTNWHEAAVCAIRITLRDYEHLLEYRSEYPLGGKAAYRIDLLVIRKLQDLQIPLSIARIFHSYNVWEIKGVHSSVTVQSYYKTAAYTSLLISADGKSPPHDRNDVSISFLCSRHPRRLFKHLTEDCKKTIANPFPGIYYIEGEMYPVQVIVTGMLPPEEALYLRCLTDQLKDTALAELLAADYAEHMSQAAYERYMNQLTNANLKEEGVNDMAICCEGIFRLYGTSYKEVEEKAAREATAPIKAQLDQTTEKLNNTTQELNNTTQELNNTTQELNDTKDKVAYLKKLLDEHGIAYT